MPPSVYPGPAGRQIISIIIIVILILISFDSVLFVSHAPLLIYSDYGRSCNNNNGVHDETHRDGRSCRRADTPYPRETEVHPLYTLTRFPLPRPPRWDPVIELH